MTEATAFDDLAVAPVPEPTCLEMTGVSKQFGGHQALEDVSISLSPGRVLALCGANGAGKSTLVRILAGAESADAGTIRVHGSEVAISAPQDATRLGLSFIHQELNLVPKFTALQNMAMGADRGGRAGVLDLRALRRKAQQVQDRIGYRVPLDARVEDLAVSDRWMVSLGRSLMRDATIVAMDEPTASFTKEEAERLYGIIDELTADGVGILYISHRLEEVLQVADDVTVLRNGRLVGSFGASELDVASLTHHIVGRDVEGVTHRVTAVDPTQGPELLTVEGLTREPRVRDVSLTLHRGEILGVAGLVGAGRTELARLLIGADPVGSGSMTLDGKPYHPRSPYDAIKAGVALVPEERRSQGLILRNSVSANLGMASLRDPAGKVGTYSPRRAVRIAREAVSRFGIKTSSVHEAVGELSGGNQQKIVVGKYVLAGPQLLILDEPTVGVDVGARSEIYDIIRGLAAGGTSILMISSDFEELAICDRVLVMREGTVTASVPASRATKDHLTALCFGTDSASHEQDPS
ncbi:sugar ABC transporter ATP-binding protein [Aeromicrobium stalagmiti]|uniref:sugar ABC transporter ATP-binding protein n=1 Tax=Aeromicrobium stalagmiti TaxID=2738988 RepID=UPI00156A7244|nr:sugar ABC transporter ATP-binding protein [Aeromicrobium stalagmiti]NRQ49469.1 sugar ABC transporter ATP-binding protein [Aeromicrobium stalagmiti]